jgi:S1-C subfamily serine protease
LIIGPGWPFLGLVVAGILALLLVPGCGIVVVDNASNDRLRLYAPGLVDVDPLVEARTSPRILAVSRARAKRHVRRGALRIRSTECDGKPTGSGFALDSKVLIAHEDVLPGAGRLKVAPRKGRRVAVDATSVIRLGDFGIARVERRLPRMLPLRRSSIALGASVAVVGYPLAAKPRLLRGVVVDRVAGAPFGVPGRVIRLTSALRHDEPGGPVIDAKGRIVAVAFTTDPETGLAVAVPIRTLRALVAKRALEALPPCDD